MTKCEKFVCEWVYEFVGQNWDKIDHKKCDLDETTKEKFLKEVKTNFETAMWVITEVMNWGMDKDYTKELCPTVYKPEDNKYRVIKLDGKYIKIIWDNKDYSHAVSFAQEKTKTVTYFE